MHVIMGSEDQVFNLMKLLDDGIKQAETIESKLDSYDKILQVFDTCCLGAFGILFLWPLFKEVCLYFFESVDWIGHNVCKSV